MEQTFFWYDLETTGVNPREGRIMQFAGQRTNMDLQPIGQPVNVLIKLTEDVLPDPEAILITGITPQQTIVDGLTEAAFLELFYAEVATPGTIFTGFNTIRFDDEFMRCLHYRNFYDAYQWQWQDGRSRWDILDLVRMTRALRPQGVKWPVVDGQPTNRLELLTELNGLAHEQAHDALSDVHATIAVAKLIRSKQPKLFDWLFNLRTKDAVKKFLSNNQTFIYSSGKYAAEVEKTAVVSQVFQDSEGALVYDLRHDPTPFIGLSADELVERWQWTKDATAPPRLPVKTLKYNRCPAISPVTVLSDAGVQGRLKITPEIVDDHLKVLKAAPEFIQNIIKARSLMDQARQRNQASEASRHCDERLYEGFFDVHDKQLSSVVRAAQPGELADIGQQFHDERLRHMLPLYKARNFPQALTDKERTDWEAVRIERLMSGGAHSRLAKYMERIAELAKTEKSPYKQYLCEELRLYGESIMPLADSYQ